MPADFGSCTTSDWVYSICVGYTPDEQDQQPELLGNPYMFTGRRFDLETGLYYYRARYYNPQIGRFLQTDPISYGDGINWYNYCGNNPANMVDPSGLLSLEDLPYNFGDPIQIQIAFYNGGDYKYGHGHATKEHLLRTANDFKVIVDGKEYDAFLDMNTADNVDMFIRNWITALNFNGYEVTDAFFFDHGGVYKGSDDYVPKPEEIGFKFGKEIWTDDVLYSWGWRVKNTHGIPENLTFHFRNCAWGGEAGKETEFKERLRNIAMWTGHNVTWSYGIQIYNSEREGPDYFFDELWMAGPTGLEEDLECIYQRWVENEDGIKELNKDQPY